MTITFSNLSKADGSSLVDENNTIVQATVFGPVDVAQSKVNYEEAIVEIIYKPKVSIPSTSPAFEYIREVENILKSVFKEVILARLHPRTSISILVQEIYNGGSLLSAAVNAICCALLDAGVPMKFPVSSVSITLEEAKDSKFDFVFDTDYNLITILSRGCVSQDQLTKAISIGQDEAKKKFETIREIVKERYGGESKSR